TKLVDYLKSARFNHLDMISIGEDHVFIIHRELLIQDIRDYLTGSSQGLHRVFVNVDYRLDQPEIMPNNRHRALESYIQDTLLPEVQHRIDSWNNAEVSTRQLPLPNKKELSLVTLTGWMLSYPINYVPPCKATRQYQRRQRNSQQQRQHSKKTEESTALSSSDDDQDETGYDSDTEDDSDQDSDEDDDNGRNCLANQVLVVTRVYLDPNTNIIGLNRHCLLSFSYPAELAARWVSPLGAPSPESPLLLTRPQDDQRVSFLRIKFPLKELENKPLPFSDPDIGAAGRSFLSQFHTRFQKQRIWASWEVGQESVTLPVVAM
ncbi:hypothetical protein BGZ94_003173, partial [Podila epigama]